MGSLCRYTENTSEWTLDYPPFFAHFERVLAKVATAVDPAIVTLQAPRLQLQSAHEFMRWSVVAADSLLVLAAGLFARCGSSAAAAHSCTRTCPAVAHLTRPYRDRADAAPDRQSS